MASPTVQFNKELGQLRRVIKEIAKHTDFTAQGMKALGVTFQELASRTNAAKSSLMNLTGIEDKAATSTLKLKEAYEKKIEALKKTQKEQLDLIKRDKEWLAQQKKTKQAQDIDIANWKKQAQIIKKAEQAQKKETAAKKKTIEAHKKHTLKLKQLMRSMKKAGIDTAKFAKENKKLIQASKKSAFAMDKLTISMKRADKAAKGGWFSFRNLRNASDGAGMSFSVFRSKLLLVNFAVGLLATNFITRLFKTSVEVAGQFEVLKTRLTALYGSVQRGSEAFDKFNKVAATTPFQLQNVVDAGAKLKAFGVDAEDMIKPVADLAAFMGVDIVEAAGAMGRAFAGGAGAADVLRERGILELIKTTQGIADLSKKTLPEFRDALITTLKDPMTGIAGSTTKLAETYQGALSNMKDATARAHAAIGDRFSDMSKRVVNSIAIMAGAIEAWATDDLDFLLEAAKRVNTDPELINLYSRMIDARDFKRRTQSISNSVVELINDVHRSGNTFVKFGENTKEIGRQAASGFGLAGRSINEFMNLQSDYQSELDNINIAILHNDMLRKEGFKVDDEEQRNLITKSRLLLETIDALHSLHSSTEILIVDSKNATKAETESVETTKEHIRNLNTLREAYYSTSQGQLELLKRQIDSMKVGLLNAKVAGETTEEYSMLSIVLDSLIGKYNNLDPVYKEYLKQQKEDIKAQKELAKERQAGADALAESFPTLEEYTKKLFIKLQMENHEKDLIDQIIKKNNELAVSLGLVGTGHKDLMEDINFTNKLLKEEVNVHGVLSTGQSDSQKIFNDVESKKREGLLKTKEEIVDYTAALQDQFGMEREIARGYEKRTAIGNALSATNVGQKKSLDALKTSLEENKDIILLTGHPLEQYEQAIKNVENAIADLNPEVVDLSKNLNMAHVGIIGLMEGLGGTMDFSAFEEASEAMKAFKAGGSDKESEEYQTFVQAKIDATANMYSQLGEMAMQFLQEENARNEQSIRAEGKRELDSLKQTMKYKRSSDAQKKALEDEALKDSNDRLKKNFRAQQAMTISSILMDAASAMMKSVAGSWVTIGQPWAGMILALSAAQIGLVASQKPPTMAQGGMVGGNRHSQGGTMIEAEQGEFVMSRSAVQSVGLESLNRMNEGGGGGGAVTVNVSGNVLSQDFVEGELAENIKEAIRRGTDFGIS